MLSKSRLIVFFNMLTCTVLFGQDFGPGKGSLLIVGGAMKDPKIIRRFIELAGGVDAPIVLIPTAGGRPEYDAYWPGAGSFRTAGARRLTVLHTTDRETADSEHFIEPLKEAQGVWFSGGRQWRLADAYLNTRTHEAIRDVLDRGGVVGGTSAGATIQGEYLVRGDTETNTIMMGDHEEGFAFLKGVAIDQHILKRNRQFDLIEVIRARPDLLGIGIDEDTAIVVRGDVFEVLGQSYVAIYDASRMLDSGGRFYFLAPGDRYNLKTREATRPSEKREPLTRIINKPWPEE